MTDTDVTTHESTEEAEASQEHTEPESNQSGTESGKSKGNPEAAKWRTRFREAEQTITTLQERVAAMQKAEAARLAAATLIDGDDLFTAVGLDDLLDDDGDLDTDKIAAQVDALIEAKPHLRRAAFSDGSGIGTRGEASSRSQTWADVLAG